MVSSEVVMGTVKRMLSTGVDEQTVKATLKGIDLSDAEIEEVIAAAKGLVSKKIQSSPEPEAEEEGEDLQDDAAPRPQEEIKEHIEASTQEQMAQHAATHEILEEHANKLDEVHRSVSDISEKLYASPQISPDAVAKINALDYRISGLEKEISETKANTIALQSLMQKILEANREIILELQQKKK